MRRHRAEVLFFDLVLGDQRKENRNDRFSTSKCRGRRIFKNGGVSLAATPCIDFGNTMVEEL